MDLRALSDKTTEPQAEAVLLVPREVRFSVTYTAPDGTKHAGALVSRVPNGDERVSIDRRAAVLAGAPWDHLSDYARARCSALALVSVQLRDMPEWAATVYWSMPWAMSSAASAVPSSSAQPLPSRWAPASSRPA